MSTNVSLTVATLWKYFKSVDRTWDGSTWKVRMCTNVSLFSGFRRVSRVPSGKAAKPSLVGAKTVNGPAEVNVSTKSPATTAATRVERSGTDWANSTMLGKASDSLEILTIRAHEYTLASLVHMHTLALDSRDSLEVLQVCGQNLGRKHVEGEDVHQCVLVLWLQESVKSALRQGSEALVGWGKDREWPSRSQCVYQITSHHVLP